MCGSVSAPLQFVALVLTFAFVSRVRCCALQAKDFEKKAEQQSLKQLVRVMVGPIREQVLLALRTGQLKIDSSEAAQRRFMEGRGRKVGWRSCSGCNLAVAGDALKVCAACKDEPGCPRYCSVACQKKDWRRHKPSCCATQNRSHAA